MEDVNYRLFIYTSAIAELLVNPERQKDSLIDAKFDALKRSWALLERFSRDGYSEKILETIMEKKAKLILEATTIKDINEIQRPPRPHYDGANWYVSKNSVPEEELIWWSKISLHAPLNYEATMRFKKLFEEFYGKSVEDLENPEGATT